ncbi:MAG: hypothetical protein RLZZ399_2324, partial [Verrucomicrobiota bacterium]
FVPTGSILTFSNNSNSAARADGSLIFQNPINFGTTVRTVQVNEGGAPVDAQLAGLLTFGTGGGLTKTGDGSLLLASGNNNGTSVTTTVSAGYLLLPDVTAIPGVSTGRTVTVSSAGALTLLGAPDATALNGALSRIVTSSAGVFALDGGSTTPTNSFGVNLDFSALSSLSLGVFGGNVATGSMGSPAYFSGSLVPNGSTYRFGSIASGRAIGVAGTLGMTYHTLVLNAPGMLTGASNGASSGASGSVAFASWNDLGGGVTVGVAAQNAISIGHDAAFGTGTLSFTSTQPGFGAILGDRIVSNPVSAPSVSSWFLVGDLTNEGVLGAGRGSLTFAGTVDFGSANSRNLYIRSSAPPVIFLGDIRANQFGLATNNQGAGVVNLLANSALTPGATPKTFTSIYQSNTYTLVIDSDRSLGAIPGSPSTSLTLNSAPSNLSGPSLMLQPGAGPSGSPVVLNANRNISIVSAANPAVRVFSGDELVVAGSISGSAGSFFKSGQGTLTLRNSNSFTVSGSLNVLGGVLKLDYANLIGAGPVVAAGEPLVLGAPSNTGASATLWMDAGTAPALQTFTSLTLNPKAAEIRLSSTGGTVSLDLGSGVTRAAGSTLALTLPASGGTLSVGGGTASTLLTDAAGSAYATYNLTDWAAKNSANTQVVAGASLAGFYTASTASSLTGNANVFGNNPTLSSDTTISSLRFNEGAARTLTLSSGTLTTGGILVTPNVGANAVTISGGGALRGTAGNDLVIVQNNPSADLVISSVIQNNGGATALVKSGVGRLVLSGLNTYTGTTYFHGGTISVGTWGGGATAGPLGAAAYNANAFLFNGGTLQYTGTGAVASNIGLIFYAPSAIEVTAASGTLTVSNYNVGISGLATVPGILRKTGAGTLTLAGSSVNTNLSVEVAAGTLNLAKTAAVSAVDQSGGASLIIGSGATARLTVAGWNQIGDTSSVLVKTGGLLDLNGISEGFDGLAGGGTVSSASAGTLTLGLNHGSAISANNLGAALAGVGATGLNAFSGAIGGALSLVKSGAGTQILSGANTYTGGTTITSGVLMAGAANVVPFGAGFGDLTLSSALIGGLSVPGVFDLGGYDQSINGLIAAVPGATQSYPIITNTPLASQADYTARTLTVGNNNASGTFAGSFQDGYRVVAGATTTGIHGRLALNKVGTGTLTLAGPGFYTGGTTLTGGTLSLGHVTALGTSGAVVFSGGTLQYAVSGSTDYSGRFSASAGQTYMIDTNGQDVTFGSALAGAGIGLTKLGTGRLILAANNTLTGGVTVVTGTLAAGNAGAFNSTSPLGVTFASGSNGLLQLGGNSLTLSGLTSSGGPSTPVVENASATGATLTVSSAGAASFTGTLRDGTGGGALSFVKSGVGTMTLSGNHNYSGTTTVAAGTLQWTGTSTGNGALSVGSGATLRGTGSAAGTLTVQGGGILAPGGLAALTLGGLVVQSGASLNFSLSNPTLSDKVVVTGSNLLTINGGTVNLSLSGGANATAGTYTLIDYAGSALSNTDFAKLTLAVSVLGANSLSVSLVNNTANTSVDLFIGSLSRIWTGAANDGGLWNLSSTGNWTGSGAFFTGDTVSFDDSASGTTSVVLNNAGTAVSPTSIAINNSTKNYSFSGVGSIGGSTAITKSGSGSLTLATANSFSGGVILNGGTLILGNAQALGSGGLTINGGSLDSSVANLAISTVNAQVWAADISFVGTQNLNLGSGGVTLSGAGRSVWVGDRTLTVGGIIGDGGAGYGLTKLGGGTLVLSGANTYSGLTSVSAGILRLTQSGALGTGSAGVTVASGASLELSGGIGISAGPVTLAGAGPGGTGAALRGVSGSNSLAGPITLTGQTTVSVDSGALTLSGSIGGGAFKLIKNGAGSLTLSGDNSSGYSGGTDVNAGLLVLTSPSAIPSTGTVSVNGAGTAVSLGFGGVGNFDANQISTLLGTGRLAFGAGTALGLDTSTASAAATYASALSLGNVGFVKSGSGTLILEGSNSYADTTVSGGTLQFGSGGAGGSVGTGSLSVSSGAAVAFQREGTTTLSQAITGGGGLRFLGGTVELGNAANNFSGGVNLLGGTLSFASGALGSGQVSVLGNATLRWNGATTDVTAANGLSVADGRTLTLDVGASSVAFANAISVGPSASAALVKQGAGTLSLNVANTFTGGFTIATGTLVMNNTGALGSSGTIQFAGNGTLRWGSGISLDLSPRLGVLPVGVMAGVDTGTNSVNFGSAITGAGGLIKLGTGALTLPVANSFGGGVILSSGTLRLANAQALGSGPLTLNGGILDSQVSSLVLSTNNALNLGGNFTFQGTQSLNLGTGAVTLSNGPTINVFARTLTIGGVMDDGGAALGFTKSGAGTLWLAGANTFSGLLTVNAGTLVVSSQGALGSAAGGTNLQAGSNLDFQNVVYSAPEAVSVSGGTISTSQGTSALGGAISFGAAGAVVNVTGTQLTLSGTLDGAGALTKRGAGTLLLSGSNTYAGVTTISAGTLVVSADNALGSTAGDTTVGVGTTLDLRNVQYTAAETLTLRTAVLSASTGTSRFGGNVVLSTGGATVDVGGTSLELAGEVSGSTDLTKTGLGTLLLSGANSFSGAVILSQGILRVTHSIALGTTSGAVTVSNGASLELASGIVVSGEALSLSGNGVSATGALRNAASNNVWGGAITLLQSARIQSDAGLLTLDVASGNAVTAANFSLTLAGAGNVAVADPIALGSGSLIKEGTGTVTLSSANTYSGTTTFAGGVLEANSAGAFGSGNLVFSGGTLRYGAGLSTDWSSRFAAIGSGATAVVDTGANSVTFGNGLSGAGSLTKLGAGTLTLQGNGALQGTVRVNEGVLVAGSNGAFGSSASLFQAGGILDVSAAGASAAALTVQAGTLRLGTAGALQLSGNAALNGGALEVLGNVDSATVGRVTLLQVGGVLSGSLALQSQPNATDYYINTLANRVDLQRRATLGSVTLTAGTSAVIVGGGTALSLSVSNTAPLQSDNLNFTAASTVALVSGSVSLNGVAAGASSGALSGFTFNAGQTAGAAQLGTVRVTGLGTTNAPVDRSVTIDVYDHASGSATGTLIALPDAFVGYAGSLAGLTSATVTNAAGYRVPLRLDGSLVTGNLSLSALSGLAAAANGTVSAALASGQSVGAIDQTFTLTYADDSALAGASSNLGTVGIRVTGNVWDHAATSFAGGTLTLGPVRVGYSSPVAVPGSLSVTAASGYRVALKGSAASAGGISLSSISGLAPSATGLITASLAVGRGAGAIDESFNYTFADDSLISGASSLLSSAVIRVVGSVYNGQGVWNTDGSGSWSDFARWTAVGGAPGLDVGFASVDTALFGAAAVTASPVVSLNGASPSLAALTFNHATLGYTIAQGSDGSLVLNGGAGVAGVHVLLGNHTVSAPISLATAATFTISNASDSLAVSGLISGANGLTKAGPGVLILSGNNTYSGDTVVTAGTLRLGAAAGIPSGVGRGDVVLDGGASQAGTLDLAGLNVTVNGLKGTSNTVRGTVWNSVGAQTATLSVGAGDASTSFSGLLRDGAGVLALTKLGAGSLMLDASQTYSGATTVSAGTLALGAGGALASGTVSVSSGATFDVQAQAGAWSLGSAQTLTGAGNVRGAFTVVSGGRLVPYAANGFATLTAHGSVSLSGQIRLRLGATAGDKLVINGGLQLGAGSTLVVLDNAGANGLGSLSVGTYELVTFTGALTNTFQTLTPATGGLQQFLSYEANRILLTVLPAVATATWNGLGADSLWNTAVNWDTGAAPGTNAGSRGQDIASLGTGTAPGTLTLSAAKTQLQILNLAAAAGSGYTLAAAGSNRELWFYGGTGTAAVNVTGGTHSVAIPVVLESDLSVAVNGSNVGVTFSGSISSVGAQGIQKTGSGTLALSGSNTYSGSTVVNAGRLIAASAGAFGGMGALSVQGGWLDLSAQSLSLGSLTLGSGGSLSLGASRLVTVSGAANLGGIIEVVGSVDSATVGRLT